MPIDEGNCFAPPAFNTAIAGSGVDVAALRVIADRTSSAAEILDNAAANHLAHLTFGGVRAGRAYEQQGDALSAGLERIAVQLSGWSRAATEIADALRRIANRYVDADHYAATRIA
ncbi:hypothetical protein MB901379_00971 [Mycobacterium basiliense]|uniref:ESX-1 secretion-associated protein EspC n=1 Tax=Mycobacterium basiliense TaxID=2094119 RepID=A0A3S4CTK9_9MYCO|nr:type VII secretion target [Mycobacterium basiliense]VDM87432.1 hypothetical protein MB901379_00971 [Mycobacterium basiliense]